MQENKYAFVAYTGSETRANTSRFYRIEPNNWSLMRHKLESFGAEQNENEILGLSHLPFNGKPGNTIIRAYEAFVPMIKIDKIEKIPNSLKLIISNSSDVELLNEIKSSAYVQVNTFLYLVRSHMPSGGHPFIPINEKSKYALLESEIKTDPQNILLKSQLKSLREKSAKNIHVTDRPIKRVDVVSHQKNSDSCVRVSTSFEFAVPDIAYLCTECSQYGLHYSDSCFLFEKPVKATTLLFGPNKFTRLTSTQETDATFYTLLHKKSSHRE